jgi:hypothetical protein
MVKKYVVNYYFLCMQLTKSVGYIFLGLVRHNLYEESLRPIFLLAAEYGCRRDDDARGGEVEGAMERSRLRAALLLS